jgi:hypothetical protein
MNSTKNILMIAIIAVTLVLGTSIAPMQSFADKGDSDHKKTKDFKSSISEKTQVSEDKAKLHMDQDNDCYRGEKCQQANQGQQVVGKDNEAKGFNDQSKNIPETKTKTNPPTQTPTQTPTPGTDSTTTNNFFLGDVKVCTIDRNDVTTAEGDTTATATGGASTVTGPICVITVTGDNNDVSIVDGLTVPTSSITPNPSDAACPEGSVNGVLTYNNIRADVCVTLPV